ncbi:MAG: DUF1565 domain-containing protein [Chitinivibrionales bacterium]|nr:DUF1565 domain-containing protein [Chitinivibrionales bacterium]
MHSALCRLLAVGLIATGAAPSPAKSLSVPSNNHPTIGAALSQAQSGDTVWVEEGVYREKVLLGPGVALKSRELFAAVLDGQGRGTVVTLAQGATVEGFEITNGTIGVISKSSDAHIVMCRIVRNSETGIMCVGHLPEIRDNIIAFNKGSGIQGWDVRVTTSTVSHNTIVHNENHGIALGGNSDVIVENCIVAFNGQYGLKAEDPTVTVEIANNDFFRNGARDRPMRSDNISVDPQFTDPYKLDFTLAKGSKCLKAGSDRQDIGARLTVASDE